MLTSKQRAQLRALANTEPVILHIGKSGINEALVTQCRDALKAREMVKGTVLENSPITAREAIGELSELCKAEQVQVIGRRFVLYKRNDEKPVIVLTSR